MKLFKSLPRNIISTTALITNIVNMVNNNPPKAPTPNLYLEYIPQSIRRYAQSKYNPLITVSTTPKNMQQLKLIKKGLSKCNCPLGKICITANAKEIDIPIPNPVNQVFPKFFVIILRSIISSISAIALSYNLMGMSMLSYQKFIGYNSKVLSQQYKGGKCFMISIKRWTQLWDYWDELMMVDRQKLTRRR